MYKVAAQHDQTDRDEDGLLDSQEVKLGTNPETIDTDSDGVNDYDEVTRFHTNPLSMDTDNDNLSDIEELFTYKSNPLKIDSDNDGLTDYDEITEYKTSPTLWDTDKGGNSDGDEINNRTNPLDAIDDIDARMDFLINGLPASKFESYEKGKIIVHPINKLELYIEKPSNTERIVLSMSNEAIEVTDNGSLIQISVPKQQGNHILKAHLHKDDGKIMTLGNIIGVRESGKVKTVPAGYFRNLSAKLAKTGPVPNVNVSLYKQNSEDGFELFTTEDLAQQNPQTTTSTGDYAFVLEPGRYKIETQRAGFKTYSTVLETAEYRIYSEDISLSVNYDPLIWGGLFISIFVTCYALTKATGRLAGKTLQKFSQRY